MFGSPQNVDLTNCDREPIHQPGAIQPHGVLLVCSAADLIISHYSENITQLTGLHGPELLGSKLTDLFPAEQQTAFAKAVPAAQEVSRPHYLFTLRLSASSPVFDAIVHRHGEKLFV